MSPVVESMQSLLLCNAAFHVSKITLIAERMAFHSGWRVEFQRQSAASTVSNSNASASRQAVISAWVWSAAVRRSG